MRKHNKPRVTDITRLKLIHRGGFCHYANNRHNTVWSNIINSLLQFIYRHQVKSDTKVLEVGTINIGTRNHFTMNIQY